MACTKYGSGFRVQGPDGSGGDGGGGALGCSWFVQQVQDISGLIPLHPTPLSPPEPLRPSLDPGPEAFCLISRVHMWRPEPLPGQAHSRRREISVLFWKTVFFPTQAAALCQSVLEVNCVQLGFTIPRPANVSQPLRV